MQPASILPSSVLDRVRANAQAFSPGIDVTPADDAGLAPAVAILKEVRASLPPARRRPAWMVADKSRAHMALLSELMLEATNFCYWAGRANFLPAGGSANLMAEIAFRYYRQEESRDGAYSRPFDIDFRRAIDQAIFEVALSGMPLVDRRVRHLRELKDVGAVEIARFFDGILSGAPVTASLAKLLALMPETFGGDLFLKRALLFFFQVHREFGLCSREDLALLPVPTDYQVPKMLAAYGAFKYSDRLQAKIANGEHLAAGSREEMEIRAATIVAVDRLAAASGLSVEEIDWALWFTRKRVTTPYHLTVTTDY